MYRLATNTVTVRNDGTAPLRVSNILGLNEGGVFKLINSDDSTFVLATGATKTIQMQLILRLMTQVIHLKMV